MTSGPWWLLTTFRRLAGLIVLGGAATVVFALWKVITDDRSWARLGPVMVLGVLVIVAGAASLATLLRRPDLRRFRFTDVPISRLGRRAWTIMRIVGLLLMLGMFVLAAVDPWDAGIPWVSVATLFGILVGAAANAQRRRPVVRDAAAPARPLSRSVDHGAVP